MLGQGFVAAAAISASVLFILSLGGLSNQEKAKRAVWYGIVGMAVAVFFTIFGPGIGNFWLMVPMVIIGAYIGYEVARRVGMTEMPQLVAALHSFVGLAAVFVGLNAEMERARVMAAKAAGEATDGFSAFAALVAKKAPDELMFLQVEVVLGVFIGAVTFTGSIVACVADPSAPVDALNEKRSTCPLPVKSPTLLTTKTALPLEVKSAEWPKDEVPPPCAARFCVSTTFMFEVVNVWASASAFTTIPA